MHCKKRLAIFPNYSQPRESLFSEIPAGGTGKSLTFFYSVCSRSAFTADGKESWFLDDFLKKRKVWGSALYSIFK
jgi:hypothetical protein